MNYCIYIKKRKNKPYCKLYKKEITFSQCQQCDNKKYKNTQLLVKTGEKSPKIHKKNRNTVKIHSRSSKLAKLERNRFSVFTGDLEHCYLCGKKKNDLHEIFGGRNRLNSIKYNLVLPLCRECHVLNQNNSFFNDYWHKQGQDYFECNIGTREEFIRIFRRNYL